MSKSEILLIVYFVVATVVIGLLIGYFYNLGRKKSNNKPFQNLQPSSSNKSELFLLRIQAYERLILLIERINPSQALLRIVPQNQEIQAYQNEVVFQIEKEFEHNIAQQIYVSEQCWKSILMAKNTIVQNLFEAGNDAQIKNANDFRKKILKENKQNEICQLAASFIRKEVQSLS